MWGKVLWKFHSNRSKGLWSPCMATHKRATHDPCQRQRVGWIEHTWGTKLSHSCPTLDVFNGKSLLWDFLQAYLRLSYTAVWSSSYSIPSFLRWQICINHSLKVFPISSYSPFFFMDTPQLSFAQLILSWCLLLKGPSITHMTTWNN